MISTVLVMACDQAPPNASVEEPPPNPGVEEPPSDAADPLRLTWDGWGELRIGMTRREVVDALGEDSNPTAVGGPDPEACDQFRPERAPAGMLVMIEQGRLTRISLSDGSGVETEGGLSVGDSASAVRRHFDSRITAAPHKYWPAPAEYLTVWTVEPPAPNARGIVYEVGPENLVVHVHAGGPSIQYVEGCL
jgi:hypothetical protein